VLIVVTVVVLRRIALVLLAGLIGQGGAGLERSARTLLARRKPDQASAVSVVLFPALLAGEVRPRSTPARKPLSIVRTSAALRAPRRAPIGSSGC
jgi:hypothetical protein